MRQYKSQISIQKAGSGTTSSSDRGFVSKAITSTMSLGRLSSGSVIVEQPDMVWYEEIPEPAAAIRVTTEIECVDNSVYNL